MKFIDHGNFDFLFLGSLEEPTENQLKVTVFPAIYAKEKSPIEFGGFQLGSGTEFWADKSRPIEVHFSTYIGYSVRNEANCSFDETEKREGKRFLVFQDSKYLEFIRNSTFTESEKPDEFKHYGIYCENHIIDVVSGSEPIVANKNRTLGKE